MMTRFRQAAWLVILAALTAGRAQACPFCSAVSQTFSQEMATMDVVVIARLVTPPPPDAKPGTGKASRAVFEVAKVLKGASHLQPHQKIETVYYGKGKPGDQFYLTAVDPPRLMWSTPVKLTPRSAAYMERLPGLPKEGAARLKFFLDYLEDDEDLLRQDAYDEFARAPYQWLTGLKGELDHGKLVKWVHDADIPVSRRRLYFVLVGISGSSKDNAWIERLLRSDDKRSKAGLDALAACYLTINGAGGLPLLEKLYLANPDAEYVDTYAVIQAIRFHGSSSDRIPRERLIQSLHLVLDRPKMADLVIPDLARWKDWSQIDRMAELFREADEQTTWLRVPVVNYLRVCPLEKAKKTLEELRKIDPQAVRRAETYFPVTGAAPAAKKTPQDR